MALNPSPSAPAVIMNASLIKSLISTELLILLAATGLLFPALPILGIRLVWLLATNPLRIS